MTDGGSDPSNDPSGATTSWPPPPPGPWGVDTGLPSEPPRPRRRRGGFIGLAVVVVLTGAIVALSFTVLGGQPDEPDQLFMPVGDSIDSGAFSTIPMDEDDPFESGDFDTIPMDEEDPALDAQSALPFDEEVEELLDIAGGGVTLEVDELFEAGEVRSFCNAPSADSLGGAMRVWTASDGQVEIEVRVQAMGSLQEAQEAVQGRQNEEFLACIPMEVIPVEITADAYGGELIDHDEVTGGPQIEQRILIGKDDRETGLLIWRQVGQYTLSIKVFELHEEGDDLDLTSADDLLEQTTEHLGG
jgi:hypothetical protein